MDRIEIFCSMPPLAVLLAVIVRGALQHRHPFFLVVAAIVGFGCTICIVRSLLRGATPGDWKVASSRRSTAPFRFWFNVLSWSGVYLGMLWLAWNIPPL